MSPCHLEPPISPNSPDGTQLILALLGGIWGIWRTVSLARFRPSPVSSCSSSLLGAHLLEEKNDGRPACDVWSWRNSEAALMRTREEQEVLDLLVKSYGRPLTEQEQWLSLAQARAGRARRSRVGCAPRFRRDAHPPSFGRIRAGFFEEIRFGGRPPSSLQSTN